MTHNKDYQRETCFDPAMSIKVTVRLLPTRKVTKVLELENGATVEGAMRALDLVPDAWIAVRGDMPLPLDELLNDKDEIKLISAVSGG